MKEVKEYIFRKNTLGRCYFKKYRIGISHMSVVDLNDASFKTSHFEPSKLCNHSRVWSKMISKAEYSDSESV